MRTFLLNVAADTVATTAATIPALGASLRNELIIVLTSVAINLLTRAARYYHRKRRKRRVPATHSATNRASY